MACQDSKFLNSSFSDVLKSNGISRIIGLVDSVHVHGCHFLSRKCCLDIQPIRIKI